MTADMINLNLPAGCLADIVAALETNNPELAARIRGIRANGVQKGIEYIPTNLPTSDWQIIKRTGILKAWANR